ncbi:MAG: hypothetical protein QOF37_2613, partial [Thermoleophilaceae bacterium]|nr:hypothetical protein [Thermoleophilaceae bacterium]
MADEKEEAERGEGDDGGGPPPA